jgi:hypothetical protein
MFVINERLYAHPVYITASDAESDWVITAIYLRFTNLLLLVTLKIGGE